MPGLFRPKSGSLREASAILRDQLLAELEGLGLNDTAGLAQGKHANARRWRRGRAGLPGPARPPPEDPDEGLSPGEPDPAPTAHDEPRSRIDKSVLALPGETGVRMPSRLDPLLAAIEGWLTGQLQLTVLAIVGRLSEKYRGVQDETAFDRAASPEGA